MIIAKRTWRGIETLIARLSETKGFAECCVANIVESLDGTSEERRSHPQGSRANFTMFHILPQ
jgi:hypothetical protein